MFRPLQSSLRFVQREVPFMLIATLSLYFVFYDLSVSRLEAAGLFAGLLGYLWFCLRTGSTPIPVDDLDEVAASRRPLWQSTLYVAAGVGLLVGGAWLLVEGAVDIARALGVSERVVGLTMVAFGTSLPELASSIAAARHGHVDIVLGNVVGSNIFNILCILGITGLIAPIPIEAAAVNIDLGIAVGFSFLVLPFHWPDMRLNRSKGAIFVGLYIAYVAYLFV